jgi:hypothetical protein
MSAFNDSCEVTVSGVCKRHRNVHFYHGDLTTSPSSSLPFPIPGFYCKSLKMKAMDFVISKVSSSL